jgi:hypothetical protein
MNKTELKLSNTAQQLIIRMTQRGRQMIHLALPAQSIRWISQVIPEALAECLQKAGVDMAALELKYRSQPILIGSVLALAIPNQDREILFYLA